MEFFYEKSQPDLKSPKRRIRSDNRLVLFCFLSRTLFGSPLDTVHLTEGINFLPSIWLFNFLSVSACFLMGAGAGWVIDYIERGDNSGVRAICAYRGALFLSFSFFLFLIWFPVLFFARRFFLSFIISTLALVSSLVCAIEWSKLSPARASLVIWVDTVWLFYIMFVSLSVWWGS